MILILALSARQELHTDYLSGNNEDAMKKII